MYLWLGFKLWMLADAMKRRVEVGWYLLLMLPFGAVVYFFVVKAPAFNIRNAPVVAEEPPVELEALQRAVTDSPSFRNRVNYGFGLLQAGENRDALAMFDAALQSHSQEKEALLGRGLALLALDEANAAIEPLAEVVDRSIAYQDYAAAVALAAALETDDRRDDALSIARATARHSHRYLHRLALAELQHRLGRGTEAMETVQALVEDFAQEPEFVRRRHVEVDERARRLLAELG